MQRTHVERNCSAYARQASQQLGGHLGEPPRNKAPRHGYDRLPFATLLLTAEALGAEKKRGFGRERCFEAAGRPGVALYRNSPSKWRAGGLP